jgi:type I restriction enzyme M protein
MNKQMLSERDICTKFITPALEKAGWDVLTQVREEFLLTKGRIIVRLPKGVFAPYTNIATNILFFEKCGPQRKGRKTTEHAWKVSAKDLGARNYNLDCKNPHEVAVELGDPDELMAEYQDITRQLQAAQQALKTELLAALKATSGGAE